MCDEHKHHETKTTAQETPIEEQEPTNALPTHVTSAVDTLAEAVEKKEVSKKGLIAYIREKLGF